MVAIMADTLSAYPSVCVRVYVCVCVVQHHPVNHIVVRSAVHLRLPFSAPVAGRANVQKLRQNTQFFIAKSMIDQ